MAHCAGEFYSKGKTIWVSMFLFYPYEKWVKVNLNVENIIIINYSTKRYICKKIIYISNSSIHSSSSICSSIIFWLVHAIPLQFERAIEHCYPFLRHVLSDAEQSVLKAHFTIFRISIGAGDKSVIKGYIALSFRTQQ